MGLFDILSRDKTSDRAIAKYTKKALNKDTQGADRMVALEKLRDTALEDEDEEKAKAAMVGLLRRLELVIPDKSIDDENEKEWAYDVCTSDLGAVNEHGLPVEAAAREREMEHRRRRRAWFLEALERAALAADSISWHLRILAQVGSDEEHWRVIERLLARNEPGYERDPSRKIQLVHHLGEMKDSRAAAALAPYLEDHDETVRFNTVESLHRHRKEDVAREPLLKALIRPEEESRRLKVRIADVLADTGWTVQGYRGQVEQSLPPEFFLDAKGHVKKKGTAPS